MLSLVTAALLFVITQQITNNVFAAPQPGNNDEINLHMPKVKPQEPDTYLCIAQKVEEAHRYITGFVPDADSNIAHHILLYGCTVPGAPAGEVWDCGEMSSTSSNYRLGEVCQEGNNILYAWAMDAPQLSLPKDVSFEIGQETEVKFLVLQVHYKTVTKFLPPQNGDDSSGLKLHITHVPTSKQAAVYIMMTDGHIPAHTIEYFESACEFEEDIEIVPFAYRTHAHSLGRVISGYRIRDGQWSEIGQKDPRLPEMFYNTSNPGMTIRRGDILAARCTMENNLDHDVAVGMTQNDEMCNFYIMYYVNHPPIMSNHICLTMGPPKWYWSDFPDQKRLNLKGIPVTASVIPGTEKPLIQNATYLDEDRTGETMMDMPGNFGDVSDEEIAEEALNDMSPHDLLNMVHQLADEGDDTSNQIWQAELQHQYKPNMDLEYGPRSSYDPDYRLSPYTK